MNLISDSYVCIVVGPRKKLKACSHFTSDPTLRNIANGIVTGPDVKVQDPESVGNKVIEDIIGK